MNPEMRDDFEHELAQLKRRFDPARWQGEPEELIHSFDEVGKYYEGDIGKKIQRGAEEYLDDRDSNLTHGERATRAINATDGQRSQRIEELNHDKGWERERIAIQNAHLRNYDEVWQQVESVRTEAARANGIDMEQTREAIRQAGLNAARDQALQERERVPQELALWDAAERRDARREEAERSPAPAEPSREPKHGRGIDRGY